MQKYRLKRSPAVIVEAEMLTEDNVDRLANIAQAQIVEEGRDRDTMREGLNIKTPNGKERLHQGMYLVKIGSSFYTAAAVNFEMNYEIIATESSPPPAPRSATKDPWEGVPRIGDAK